MLGRTQKKAEHWREREVEDGRRQIERGEMEKSTYMHGKRPSFLLIFACLTVSDIVGHCAHVSF